MRLLQARAYRDRKHCVLTVDTSELLRRHIDRVTLCPMNSGCTLFVPPKRGSTTFLPFKAFPFKKHEAVELVVEYNVPDIADFTVRANHMLKSDTIEQIYEA